MSQQDLKVTGNGEDDFERLSKKQFDIIRAYLHKTSGISLADNKINMVHNRIKKRKAEIGFATFDEYLTHMKTDKDKTEAVHLVNALTTNVTHFFREGHHFEHLKTALKNQLKSGNNKIVIWSAACSIGAEPYSIAITVEEALKEEPSASKIKILATDIDTLALARGRKGEYPERISKGLTPRNLGQYFTTTKDEDGKLYTVKDKIRKRISYNYLNFNDPDWPMKGPFDFIFCRNVFIYFQEDKQQEYINKMTKLLRPGGFLYLGHSEYFISEDKQYKALGQTVFQKL